MSAKALQAIGGLDEAIVAYQKWDTAIRLAKLFEFAFVPEPTFVYDCRGTDTISKNSLRAAKGYEQILRKHFRDIALRAGPAQYQSIVPGFPRSTGAQAMNALLGHAGTFHSCGGRALVCRFGT